MQHTIAERAQLCGGTLRVTSSPGQGTTVALECRCPEVLPPAFVAGVAGGGVAAWASVVLALTALGH